MHKSKEAMQLSLYMNDFVHSLFRSGVEIDTLQSCLQRAKRSQIDLVNVLYSFNSDEQKNAVSKRIAEVIDECEIVKVSKDPHEFEKYIKEDF